MAHYVIGDNEYRNDIPEKYDNMYVYGIGMERISDHKKRMVLVLSDNPRQN